MTANLLLAVSGLILLVLCLGVYLSNPRKTVNKALTAFLFSGFLWLLANFLTNISYSKSLSLLFARSTLIGAALIPLAFLAFVVSYTGYKKLRSSYLFLISILPGLIILSTPTSLNIKSIEPGGRDAVTGPIYFLLLVVIFGYFGYGVYLLLKFYKRASTIERAQLQYIFVGLVLTTVPALITNGILPILGSSQASAYGPISVVAISVFTTVAIIRHKLLDIRLIVARSLGYILSLGFITLLISLTLFGLSSAVASSRLSITTQRVISVLVTIVLVLTYPRLKAFFDRVTNKLFYRDAYDPQVFLDQLNSALVSNIDLKKLLSISSKTISNNIKAEYCSFGIQPHRSEQMRLFGMRDIEFSSEDLIIIHDTFTGTRSKVILASELGDSQQKLQEVLQKHSIMAVSRLITHAENLGFLFLGEKKSGNIYSRQDARILELISDELAIAIQNSLRFEEIRLFNITLQQKIEEATRELSKANTRLKELDKTKDEFISMASHQLRTPLTTVKGYLSMILDGDVGPVTKNERQMIQRAFDGADRMVYLIADLLNVSRLQSGKFVIENKPTDLAKVVETEISQLKESATNHELKLMFHKPEKFPTVNLDETKIRQVIMNFMDNAIYYTPKGGNVDVALQATDKEITYTVTDTGLGVPEAEQHKLFAKFYRAGNARKMRPDGTGLGLFMAKKVIVAQGGAIIFKSTEGKGSTFGFSFPRHAVEAKEQSTPKPEARPALTTNRPK